MPESRNIFKYHITTKLKLGLNGLISREHLIPFSIIIYEFLFENKVGCFVLLNLRNDTYCSIFF